MDLWNRLNFTRRLFVWLLVYSLMLVGCFILFQYRREKEFKASELNSQLQIINGYIADELAEGIPVDSIRPDRPAGHDEIRITVIDPAGRVIYDNSLDSLPSGDHSSRREILAARSHGQGYTLRRHSESTGETYFYSATRAEGGMIVRSAVPYTLSLHHLLKADYTFLWVMGGISLLFCTLGFFATRRVGQHITRLKDFAGSVERGEKIWDTAPFPHDELGDISNNIVRLYARLQQALADRDRQHTAAMREQRDKERIKKQLTNNINHELKTPVASIQICLETLLAHQDMDPSKRHEFIARSLANTHRLRRLLTDVSTLTRIEDGSGVIAMSPVDLSALIARVGEDCLPAAQDKGMKIELAVSPGLKVCGNSQFLESVFYNLIDNAIAYSGGSRIRIVAATDPSSGRISISIDDDGCGVAPEHLDHLFERFYRVDKGRSRATGGTGLGLSIVKNAVLLHGGSIGVDNRSEGGLVFAISLPAADALQPCNRPAPACGPAD